MTNGSHGKPWLVAVLPILLLCCQRREQQQPQPPTRQIAAMPRTADADCPHYWSIGSRTPSGARAPGDSLLVPLSGAIRDIPEYHDCQRLTLGGSASPSYGALGAVFASARLPQLLSDQQHATLQAGSTRAIAAATILAIGDAYAGLGILKGTNCVYLWKERGWRARIFHVDDRGAECTHSLDPVADHRGLNAGLEVQAQRAPAGFKVPPVARWERTTDSVQAVGMMCGDEWCVIGRRGFHLVQIPAPTADRTLQAWLDTLPGQSPGSLPASRLLQFATVPGWSDYQLLASQNQTPSLLMASVIPHPALDGTPESAYGRWRVAAFVWFPDVTSTTSEVTTHYHGKYNFAPGWSAISWCGATGSANCFPAAAGQSVTTSGPTCQPIPADEQDVFQRWYARVQPQHGPAKTFCARRCPRQVRVIGTARWRWLKSDESLWAPCGNACCVIDPSGS